MREIFEERKEYRWRTGIEVEKDTVMPFTHMKCAGVAHLVLWIARALKISPVVPLHNHLSAACGINTNERSNMVSIPVVIVIHSQPMAKVAAKPEGLNEWISPTIRGRSGDEKTESEKKTLTRCIFSLRCSGGI